MHRFIHWPAPMFLLCCVLYTHVVAQTDSGVDTLRGHKLFSKYVKAHFTNASGEAESNADSKEIIKNLAIDGDSKTYVLKLHVNEMLRAKHYTFIGENQEKQENSKSRLDNCVFHGEIEGFSESMVAISNCSGWHGMLVFNDSLRYSVLTLATSVDDTVLVRSMVNPNVRVVYPDIIPPKTSNVPHVVWKFDPRTLDNNFNGSVSNPPEGVPVSPRNTSSETQRKPAKDNKDSDAAAADGGSKPENSGDAPKASPAAGAEMPAPDTDSAGLSQPVGRGNIISGEEGPTGNDAGAGTSGNDPDNSLSHDDSMQQNGPRVTPTNGESAARPQDTGSGEGTPRNDVDQADAAPEAINFDKNPDPGNSNTFEDEKYNTHPNTNAGHNAIVERGEPASIPDAVKVAGAATNGTSPPSEAEGDSTDGEKGTAGFAPAAVPPVDAAKGKDAERLTQAHVGNGHVPTRVPTSKRSSVTSDSIDGDLPKFKPAATTKSDAVPAPEQENGNDVLNSLAKAGQNGPPMRPLSNSDAGAGNAIVESVIDAAYPTVTTEVGVTPVDVHPPVAHDKETKTRTVVEGNSASPTLVQPKPEVTAEVAATPKVNAVDTRETERLKMRPVSPLTNVAQPRTQPSNEPTVLLNRAHGGAPATDPSNVKSFHEPVVVAGAIGSETRVDPNGDSLKDKKKPVKEPAHAAVAKESDAEAISSTDTHVAQPSYKPAPKQAKVDVALPVDSSISKKPAVEPIAKGDNTNIFQATPVNPYPTDVAGGKPRNDDSTTRAHTVGGNQFPTNEDASSRGNFHGKENLNKPVPGSHSAPATSHFQGSSGSGSSHVLSYPAHAGSALVHQLPIESGQQNGENQSFTSSPPSSATHSPPPVQGHYSGSPGSFQIVSTQGSPMSSTPSHQNAMGEAPVPIQNGGSDNRPSGPIFALPSTSSNVIVPESKFEPNGGHVGPGRNSILKKRQLPTQIGEVTEPTHPNEKGVLNKNPKNKVNAATTETGDYDFLNIALTYHAVDKVNPQDVEYILADQMNILQYYYMRLKLQNLMPRLAATHLISSTKLNVLVEKKPEQLLEDFSRLSYDYIAPKTDLSFLITQEPGRQDVSLFGYAYVGKTCEPYFSTGFIVTDPRNPFDYYDNANTMVHEIGHSLGLEHVSSGIMTDSRPQGEAWREFSNVSKGSIVCYPHNFRVKKYELYKQMLEKAKAKAEERDNAQNKS